jgi:16S rRNA (uracil1498-N3)-methyltransferase
MTQRRWIADEVHGNRAALTGQNARHLSRVLRARVGQEFDISFDSTVRLGKIVAIDEDRVELELGDEVSQPAEPEISLLVAVFKFDRMEWAIEKAVELGVTQIYPVIAQRTDAHLGAAAAKRAERWRKIAHEAAQQSRRAAVPEIVAPQKLKAAMAGITDSILRVVLSETEKSVTLAEVLSTAATENSVVLAIGPEGGWTQEEVETFTNAGWNPASLGNTVLRAETAAIAALAVARALR